MLDRIVHAFTVPQDETIEEALTDAAATFVARWGTVPAAVGVNPQDAAGLFTGGIPVLQDQTIPRRWLFLVVPDQEAPAV